MGVTSRPWQCLFDSSSCSEAEEEAEEDAEEEEKEDDWEESLDCEEESLDWEEESLLGSCKNKFWTLNEKK